MSGHSKRWHIYKIDLETIPVSMCVKTSENSSFRISGITRPFTLKFGVHLKQTQPFLWYHFRKNWFIRLGFSDDLNFLKNVCNCSSCPKFKAMKLNSSQRDQGLKTVGTKFGENHQSVQILWYLKFFGKLAFLLREVARNSSFESNSSS